MPSAVARAGLASYWECCNEVVVTEKPGKLRTPNWRFRVARGMAMVIEEIAYKRKVRNESLS